MIPRGDGGGLDKYSSCRHVRNIDIFIENQQDLVDPMGEVKEQELKEVWMEVAMSEDCGMVFRSSDLEMPNLRCPLDIKG